MIHQYAVCYHFQRWRWAIEGRYASIKLSRENVAIHSKQGKRYVSYWRDATYSITHLCSLLHNNYNSKHCCLVFWNSIDTLVYKRLFEYFKDGLLYIFLFTDFYSSDCCYYLPLHYRQYAKFHY